ncbi:hypothetical protein LX70_00546 [Defluviimonas denitrificans]|jgi:hypothetical protein|uniref:HNH endonuclease n=1 Tax=Albidovulum denitrificans TaxID=404881 RepID=A0A2S8SD66_9RHOB|nr:hypothetical protein [Defluviimonas denitrificans]PQV58733.1 hypothetical protein LX70_00546 [Defluviimonas denitrificans]
MTREKAAQDAGRPEWLLLPGSAPEARGTGSHKYFTGRPCKRGHIDIRTTRDGHCMACERFMQGEIAKRPGQREKAREYERNRYHSNPSVKAYVQEYQSRPEVRERDRANKARWHQDNKPRRIARIKEWEQENPDRVREYTAARRAAEMNAMPAWVDREALRAVYDECARLTFSTGEVHHVDHIVPLVHPNVCGLHVPLNLQVLTAAENLRKKNSFDGTLDNDGWRG